MSSSSRKIIEHEQGYQRQAEILRNKLYQWDQVLSTTGEEWPEQMGRFNASLVRFFVLFFPCLFSYPLCLYKESDEMTFKKESSEKYRPGN